MLGPEELRGATVGQRIMWYRNRLPKVDGRRVSGAELARRLVVNKSTVSSWERDEKTPEGQNLVNLAQALNCQPEDILPPAALQGAATAPMAQLSGTIEVAEAKRAVADAGKARRAEQEGAADEPPPVGDEGHQSGGS